MNLRNVDHLVYSTMDLERSVAELEDRLGVRAIPGGRHPGRGTRNALIALSDWSYLEIIGPDPTQTESGVHRWFGIDSINTPCLITWAAKGTSLNEFAAAAAQQGVHLGPVLSGSRTTPKGVSLHWQFTDPATVVGDGLVPFFIDWGDSPHPAASAPGGAVLVGLRGEHPKPASIDRYLKAVGIGLFVEQGTDPALIATLKTAKGIVELR